MTTHRFEYPDHADDGQPSWQQTLQDAVDNPLETAEQCVAEHPLATVGATMAAGFLGGLVVAGMLADVRRSRERRSLPQRARREFSHATDRAGDLLGDITQTVRNAVADAMPDLDDVMARFR